MVHFTEASKSEIGGSHSGHGALSSKFNKVKRRISLGKTLQNQASSFRKSQLDSEKGKMKGAVMYSDTKKFSNSYMSPVANEKDDKFKA